ncbi:MAG: hypothetical protein EXS48_01155 [Candidatus Staskawiczbacteria bacterium]|nr:hypothetical protein [Candidatus Staskawiczbacteria bacterium]
MKIKNSEKGVALIMVFLMMTIMVSMVLGINAILLSEVKLLGRIGNSSVALIIAENVKEEALYHIRNGGICDVCNNCPTCDNCTISGTSPNCTVYFESTDSNGGQGTVLATITYCETLVTNATGYFNGVMRKITSTYGSGGSGGNHGAMFRNCVKGPPSI